MTRYEVQVNRVVAVAVEELISDVVQSATIIRELLKESLTSEYKETHEDTKNSQRILLHPFAK
jgi:hypothetical protein